MQQIALYGPSNVLGAQMATHIPSFQTRHDNRLAVPFAARWSSADHPGLHIPAPPKPPPPVCGAGCCSALRPPPPPTTAQVPRSSPVDSAAQALLLYTFCHKPTHPPEPLLLYQPRSRRGPCVFSTSSYRQQLPILSPCPNMCPRSVPHRVLPKRRTSHTASCPHVRGYVQRPHPRAGAHAPRRYFPSILVHRRTAAPPHRRALSFPFRSSTHRCGAARLRWGLTRATSAPGTHSRTSRRRCSRRSNRSRRRCACCARSSHDGTRRRCRRSTSTGTTRGRTQGQTPLRWTTKRYRCRSPRSERGVRRRHICAGTGPSPATSEPGLGPPLPDYAASASDVAVRRRRVWML